MSARHTKCTVITCSNDEAKYANLQNSIEKAFRTSVQIIRIENTASLAEGYNQGFQEAIGDHVVFCHDDIEFLSPDVEDIINQDMKDFDIVGVAGTSRLLSGNWISAGQPFIHGHVAHRLKSGGLERFNLCQYGFGRDPIIVPKIQALDGLLIAVKRSVIDKVRFDANTFDGFHLYDLDFTYSAYLQGFRIAIDHRICLIHCSGGKYDDNWYKYKRLFEEKYAENFIKAGPKGISTFNAKVLESRQEVVKLMKENSCIEADHFASYYYKNKHLPQEIKKFEGNNFTLNSIKRNKKLVFQESRLAHMWLDGLKGLEIGPSSQNPFGLNTRNVGLMDEIYENEQMNMVGEAAYLDIISRADDIPVQDESEDFILSSHVIEHCPNFIKTLLEWYRIVRKDGFIFMIVPHRNASQSDAGRPLTDWHHLIDDYTNIMTEALEPEAGKFGHCHYHVFDFNSMKAFVDKIFGRRLILVASQEIDDKVGNGFSLVYKKATPLVDSFPWQIAEGNIKIDIRSKAKLPSQSEREILFPTNRFVNICIVTYNRLDFTRKAIQSIQRHTRYPHVITVVDNNSQDGTKEYLTENKRNGLIKNLILLTENIGVAKASNLAWQQEPDAAYYLKYDNDIVIQKPDWLLNMVKVLDSIPELGAIGYNFEQFSYPIKNVNGHKIRIKSANIGGACYLIPKRVEKKIGYWCEDYGLYGEEDRDYSLRLRLAGYYNAYMEDENIGLHLPGGRAAMLDSVSKRAVNSPEIEKEYHYRTWKDSMRQELVKDGGILQRNVFAYYNRIRSLYVPRGVFLGRLGRDLQVFDQDEFFLFLPVSKNIDTYKIETIKKWLYKNGISCSQIKRCIVENEVEAFRIKKTPSKPCSVNNIMNSLTHSSAMEDKTSKMNSSETHFQPLEENRSQFMTLSEIINRQAYRLIETKEKAAGEWLLGKLLEDYPECALAHHNLAVVAYEDGDMDKAEHHFGRAAALETNNFIFQKSHADLVWASKSAPKDAIPLYLKALEIQPDDLESLLIVAQLYVSMGDFDQGVRFLEKVLEIEPDHQEAAIMIGQIQQRIEFSGAGDKSAQDYYKSAQNKLNSGDRDGASRDLENALREDGEFALAHNDLAVLAYEKGDMQAASRHYEAAVAYEPYNIVFSKNLGDFYYKEAGDVTKALEKYVQAMRLDPQDVEVLSCIGDVCLNIGKSEDARFFFQRILEIDSGNVGAVAGIERISAIENGRRSAPSNKETENRDLHELALEYAAAGQLVDAIRALEQLVDDKPSNAVAHNDLAVLNFENGNSDKALKHYENAVQIQPDHPVFLKNLADFYYVVQKRTEDALAIYVRLLDRNREDLDCLVAAGTICEDLGMTKDARLFFKRVLEIDPENACAAEVLARLPEPQKGVGQEGSGFGHLSLSTSVVGHQRGI